MVETGPESNSPCPCGSGNAFPQCCGRFLDSRDTPATAEALMRSRYCAFVMRNSDYLVATHHPATRDEELESDLIETIANTRWLGLEIVSRSQGGPKDKLGKVHFRASFQRSGSIHVHEEISRFKRSQGQWRYLDGKMI